MEEEEEEEEEDLPSSQNLPMYPRTQAHFPLTQ
jgi:hypothetical protein